MRQIVLDTETTGLETRDGHRIIEIGCVEMIDRKMTGNNYHQYLQPDRLIDEEALAVHGITPEFLSDKPRFNEVARDFLEYIQGAELIIHNAPFDIGFLNYELSLLGPDWGNIESRCKITDSLVMAREMYPGQRNSLDALCKRLDINNSHRELHGALLDSEILGDVYLGMTGGQVTMTLETSNTRKNTEEEDEGGEAGILSAASLKLRVVRANDDELAAHNARMEAIEKAAGKPVWH
ncbi:DNA polymerase III subunit epsilon [Leucothrix mucor]|uniref:DNA polymerase III subunit epsilon n=1 Tax=Leucothrix mucor TaxID=45248 RepID=UPI0003B7B37C|nr:DNA polymerase III subunit epsilon [Leucothrix mucor]